MKINTVIYVNSTEIIPKEWNNWFWTALSDSSTITFGDNDYSLVSADRFLCELEIILDDVLEDFKDEYYTEEQVNSIKETIADLIEKDVYINL